MRHTHIERAPLTVHKTKTPSPKETRSMNLIEDLLDLASLEKNAEKPGFAMFASAGSSSSSSSSCTVIGPGATVIADQI